MFSIELKAVIKRELREKILSKAFVIMTLLIPVFMFGVLGFQTLMFSMDDDDHTVLEIITESPELASILESEFNKQQFVKNNRYQMFYDTMSPETFDDYLPTKKDVLIDEHLTGIVYIADSAKVNKSVSYYSKAPKNLSVTQKISDAINKTLISVYFEAKNLSEDDLDFARSRLEIREMKVTSDDKIEEQGYGNLIFSYLFTFLLYISLLMMGSMALQSVITEKTNRIVEVLLSSISAKELMTGKILGSSIMGLAQMAIWLTPVFLVISTSLFVLPPEFLLSIDPLLLFYFLINFFIGLLTFIALFTMVGSMFENAQEAQTGQWPIMILIIIPFFVALTMLQNPSNSIAEIFSLMPFASIMVMPGRMTLIEVPVWQVILHFVVNVGTIMAIFPIAGKIFRIGILKTGKKPSLKEIVQWMRLS